MTQPTAVLEPAAPATDLGAEAPVEIPEIEPQGVPDAALETPEPEADVDPYADLSPEEIEARAREGHISEEEHRRRLEEQGRRIRESLLTEQRQQAAVEAYTRKIREDQAEASQAVVNDRANRIWNAISGELDMDRDGLMAELQAMYRGAALVGWDQMPQAANPALVEMGFQQGVAALDGQFRADFYKARAEGDQAGGMAAIIRFVREKQHEASIAWYEAQQGERQTAEQQAAAEAQRLQQERQKAKAPVTPTGGRGNATARGIQTFADAERMYGRGEIDVAEFDRQRTRFGVTDW